MSDIVRVSVTQQAARVVRLKAVGPQGATGASGNLDDLSAELGALVWGTDLGWAKKTEIPFFKFDTAAGTPASVVPGTLWWDSADNTLALNINDVTLQMGQELFVYGYNNTGSTIADGTPVSIVGSSGTRPTITPTNVADPASCRCFIGLATENIINNSQGMVTTHGLVRGINTNVYNEGDRLWVTGVGGLTATEPTTGNKILAGMVVKKAGAGAGIIFSNPNPFELTAEDRQALNQFESDGFLKFRNDARYWRDIDFPIIIRTTGAGIPSLTTLNGNITLPQWQVNDVNVCESQEFVHEWAEGTEAFWHIHLTTNGQEAVNKYVRFSIEFGYVAPDGQWTFPAVMDSGDLLIPANTPTRTMKIFSLGSFVPTGVPIAGHTIAVLRRIASSGAAPVNDPWVAMLQMHVLCDTAGSRERQTK